MKNTTQLTLLVVGLFCTIAPLIWCGVVYIISYTSGWQSLSKLYPTNSLPANMKLCNGIIGGSKYSWTLEYAATEQGLYLKTTKLFSVGHNPLFIPWTAVENYQNGSFWLLYHAKFKVNDIAFYLSEDVKPNVTSRKVIQTNN